MVTALLALLATLGAMGVTGLLVSRASKDRLLYLIAWSATQVGLSLALLCMTIGLMAGFAGPMFRVMELGAALVAPLWLALGMIELIARYVQVRFGAWLFTVSYTVVAVVILVLDPLKGSLGKSLPKPGDTYDALPLLLLDGAHVVAVISLAACTGVTAWLASKRDREAAELLIPVALVALAGVLVVSGVRGFLPAPLVVIALGAAAGLVWYGAMRTIPVYDDEDYAGDYDDEPATGYDARPQVAEPPARQAPPVREPQPGRRRRELRFPEPAPDGLAGAPPTTVDTIRPPVVPSPGGELPAGCGQITVYTLLDGRVDAFDRLAGELIKAARAGEPDTLIFACHEVVGAPAQRIFYMLFRDEAAFSAHRRQPHLQRFLTESRPHVRSTNVIELKLGQAKVPLPAPEFPRR
ncbi:putative quinol monooxygenase [Spirillospora albida]|uniref:putative quinol monooxygenase n=1 Tax=Spirillospora albida TaxID=58123 RepID=UPI0004C06F8F|nr:antibiotic biosynthesis monooxygenase [Spirillospora albida]